jgi:hypothetical protein
MRGCGLDSPASELGPVASSRVSSLVLKCLAEWYHVLEMVSLIGHWCTGGNLSIYLSVCLSIYPFCSHLKHRASVKCFVSIQFLIESVGLLGLGISPVARALPTEVNAYNRRRQTSVPWVGFESTIPVSERAKTFHALDITVTMIGGGRNL